MTWARSGVRRVVAYGCATVLVVLLAAGGWIAWQIRGLFASDPAADAERAARAARLDQGRTAVPGTSLDVALDGCAVYRTPRGAADWTEVSLPYAAGSYPAFMTGCTRASVRVEGEWVLVETCAQAIGAGGGCARSGTFRTRDAIRWERRDERATPTRWVSE